MARLRPRLRARPGAIDHDLACRGAWRVLVRKYQYEQVQPGLAERIVAMAETVATGEIKTRDKLADAEIERARSGQVLAFLLTIIALGAAIYFFAARDPVAGGALLSFPVIMLIRSFLIGLRGESADRREADDASTSG
jgi:uncharacterized membrane protein